MKKPNFSLYFNLFLCLTFLGFTAISAQEYFPKNDGVKTKNNNFIAFTNATIIVSPKQTIKNGTLLVKGEKVIDVGGNITIPKNTIKVDLDGKSIYPSFIDVYSDFGITKPKPQRGSFGQAPQYDTNRKGYYWNEHIRAETNALNVFKFDSKKAEDLRSVGFGMVNTHLQDGIVRGNGVLVALNSEGSDANRLLDVNSSQYLSFNKSNASRQVYPTSLMGAMALLRQLYLDADWYAKGNVETKDLTLEAFNRNKNLKQIFYAGDKHNALRADKIGDQFGIQYTIVGKGNEYQLIDEIKNTNATFIIPLNFPKAYDVANPYQADHINLEDMRYWNQAPTNLSVLAKNNVPFSITASELKSLKDFTKNLQKAIDYGLDKTKALEALTTIPAQILGKSNQIGTLNKGMQANFLITDGDIFNSKTKLYENWVQGTKNVIKNMSVKDLSGSYTLSLEGKTYDLTFSGDAEKPKVSIKQDTIKLKGSVTYSDNWLGLVIMDKENVHKLNARVHTNTDNINGDAHMANGKMVSWSAIKKPSEEKKKEEKEDKGGKKVYDVVPVTYPNIGYGFLEKPKEETILFKNATVWTNESEGILKNTDVLLKNGKIAKIGSNLSAGSAKVVDATGKHLTSGIVDEHSHVAAQSVNEAGQNSSAEVTIEDNIDSEDINIYRNLGGGVTTMQILHGSANPIGGRSAIIKLKWGEIGDDMIYTNTPKFIKFALGENVKQSRYPTTTNRFP
ncbi:amidohydrolase family protein [Aureibaculum sp. 2210JD6-5]|uniref:amidohydrolase family protein n=1 Tax=Aureibaculum sp. 2210JD6-5 TaxID=3103957 RepID=UPI0039F21C3B